MSKPNEPADDIIRILRSNKLETNDFTLAVIKAYAKIALKPNAPSDVLSRYSQLDEAVNRYDWIKSQDNERAVINALIYFKELANNTSELGQLGILGDSFTFYNQFRQSAEQPKGPEPTAQSALGPEDRSGEQDVVEEEEEENDLSELFPGDTFGQDFELLTQWGLDRDSNGLLTYTKAIKQPDFKKTPFDDIPLDKLNELHKLVNRIGNKLKRKLSIDKEKSELNLIKSYFNSLVKMRLKENNHPNVKTQVFPSSKTQMSDSENVNDSEVETYEDFGKSIFFDDDAIKTYKRNPTEELKRGKQFNYGKKKAKRYENKIDNDDDTKILAEYT